MHNYPNGSLVKVLDSEVRGKLQSVFGLEVTDLPMETLKKAATPHILNTVKEVTEFFKERGISRGMNMRDRHLNSWDRRVLIL